MTTEDDHQVPDFEVLDRELRADRDHLEARAEFHRVLDQVTVLELKLELEEAANQVVATATDVGFRLGVRERRCRDPST